MSSTEIVSLRKTHTPVPYEEKQPKRKLNYWGYTRAWKFILHPKSSAYAAIQRSGAVRVLAIW